MFFDFESSTLDNSSLNPKEPRSELNLEERAHKSAAKI